MAGLEQWPTSTKWLLRTGGVPPPTTPQTPPNKRAPSARAPTKKKHSNSQKLCFHWKNMQAELLEFCLIFFRVFCKNFHVRMLAFSFYLRIFGVRNRKWGNRSVREQRTWRLRDRLETLQWKYRLVLVSHTVQSVKWFSWKIIIVFLGFLERKWVGRIFMYKKCVFETTFFCTWKHVFFKKNMLVVDECNFKK